MRRILALDQSLANTGYVIYGERGVETWGVIKTKPEDPLGARLHMIFMSVELLYLNHDCTELIMESMAHGALSRDNRPAAVYGVLTHLAHQHCWPLREANLSTVKKSFAGTGRATKAQMKEAAHAEGFEGWKNEHAADAYAIARWVWEQAA